MKQYSNLTFADLKNLIKNHSLRQQDIFPNLKDLQKIYLKMTEFNKNQLRINIKIKDNYFKINKIYFPTFNFKDFDLLFDAKFVKNSDDRNMSSQNFYLIWD